MSVYRALIAIYFKYLWYNVDTRSFFFDEKKNGFLSSVPYFKGFLFLSLGPYLAK